MRQGKSLEEFVAAAWTATMEGRVVRESAGNSALGCRAKQYIDIDGYAGELEIIGFEVPMAGEWLGKRVRVTVEVFDE